MQTRDALELQMEADDMLEEMTNDNNLDNEEATDWENTIAPDLIYGLISVFPSLKPPYNEGTENHDYVGIVNALKEIIEEMESQGYEFRIK